MPSPFITRFVSNTPDAVAPDGSEVRLLAAGTKGSMAHFELAPGQVSKAVAHRTVEELWFFTAGVGSFWRKNDTAEEVIQVEPGVSLAIAPGTHFQFRSEGDAALEAVGVTMPPWPGPDEAYEVTGNW